MKIINRSSIVKFINDNVFGFAEIYWILKLRLPVSHQDNMNVVMQLLKISF